MGERSDIRKWDEEEYRSSILQEREIQARTVFRTAFAPSTNPNPDLLVVASSDGSVAPYSLPSCIYDTRPRGFDKSQNRRSGTDFVMAEPLRLLQGHKGPAYDVKFYGEGDDSLLLSCGDDGRIQGWRWKEMVNLDMPMPMQGNHLNPVLDLVNPQHKGPWGSLSPIPENNAIAVDTEGGTIFSAAGDACAYCWDVETSKCKMVFRGHSNYLHCIVARHSSNQIITGSEDGTARIWDCRSGKCIQVIVPKGDSKLNEAISWISCLALDTSESWLACGSGRSLSVWSLPTCERILNIDTRSPTQDVLFDDNQILAVGAGPCLTRYNSNGMVLSQIQCAPATIFSVSHHSTGVTAVAGYGGLVDVISDFGSHLCTFRCKGGNQLNYDALFSPIPIHLVTHPSQLPPEFLEPSVDKKLVVGFDCEGVDLCRYGTLCIMQLAFPDAVYVVDAIQGGGALMQACKPALESSYITKVVHDCKRDSEALYFQFGIKLNNVMDTQIAYSLIEEQEGRKRTPDDYISFVGLLADPRYCGISYLEKEEVRFLLRQDPLFWTYRPLSELMVRAAVDDVRFLLYIYDKMLEQLNQQSLWLLAIRGSLYCRCFCINDNDYADWPSIPPIPDNLITEGNVPEEEILSVLHVPPGKMGIIIGRRGASILSVKESCNAEILIGGSKGPPDKVFIIGPVKQVRKAEAILRGRMLEV